ncbi:hypothetical protein [Bartonella krasnovii]|uniref:Uncharacterized protein n=1 Tax=Bartonella krasnovii TaxID=2267275 RepID=A0ABY3VTF3_9HYPH|nr:hypothetical protein [Bartonella krasnovii]UNF28649.1 hypothetical protein MNL13_05305 [Bartonella krasnovii]UNF35025.1 hypothetical protein MNL12_05305 [Bartonella krasnovii]UNF36661.1 hypothetical protein MNL11_06035 [Bartonella krasnovii]UNF38433.1 hypothetical protein MNL10_06745 [Bartonella krasnovii]UNF40070.1 hypothetical protein MNL09_06250 [Bartonella krasnovii]
MAPRVVGEREAVQAVACAVGCGGNAVRSQLSAKVLVYRGFFALLTS